MARSRRANKPVKQKVDNKVEVYDEPDPERDDFFHDDVDKFHAEREKILLDSTAYSKDWQEESSDDNQRDEVVMALNFDEFDEESEDGGDDDEEEEEGEDDDLSINEDGHGEDEDDEIDKEDDEEESENEGDAEKGIPSQKSWGRKKAAFYDADIMEEYAASDEEMNKLAEEEEEEALALQKHMATSLEEQDFDVAQFEFQLPDIVPKKDKYKKLDEQKIVQDLSKLSKAEKIQILIKDSPELLKLLDEFKFKLKEVIEKLHPLVKMARAGQVPKEGADYLELKHQLYLNYCVNIGFYLYLKARQTSVRDHPLIERLLQYKKLITELEPLDEKLKPEVEVLLSQGQISRENGLEEKSNANGHDNKKSSKKLQRTGKLSSLLDDDDSDTDDNQDKTQDGGKGKTDKEGKVKKPEKDSKRKRKVEGKTDEMDPLEYYEAVKLQKKKKQEAKEAALSFSTQRVMDEEETGDGKRGITYEISQNKGLTAKKKKELRNPRVKHRRKFYKAQIKRKSQVLPVVNEQNRYGGEMTGIRSHLTRSVKIK